MVKIKQLMVVVLVFISMNSYAMEMDRNKYIDFSNEQMEQIAYHTGNLKNLRFYNEYHAQSLPDGKVSFKLDNCDQVPLNEFGAVKYFFSSATTGNLGSPGVPFIVEDPTTTTDIIAVRGKNDVSGHRVDIYGGFDKNSPIKKGKKKIYLVKALALFTKSTENVDQIGYPLIDSVRHGRTDDLTQEIRKRIKDRKDFDWRKPEFQRIFLELLGEGWVKAHDAGSRDDYFTRDEAVVGYGNFHSSKVYWTQTENKLKGIAYRKKP